jgi:hypothetical protein
MSIWKKNRHDKTYYPNSFRSINKRSNVVEDQICDVHCINSTDTFGHVSQASGFRVQGPKLDDDREVEDTEITIQE